MFGFLKYLSGGTVTKSTAVPQAYVRETKKMRQNLSESSIDKTLENSFPASDPPAWY